VPAYVTYGSGCELSCRDHLLSDARGSDGSTQTRLHNPTHGWEGGQTEGTSGPRNGAPISMFTDTGTLGIDRDTVSGGRYRNTGVTLTCGTHNIREKEVSVRVRET
jgi:hypothetical protein